MIKLRRVELKLKFSKIRSQAVKKTQAILLPCHAKKITRVLTLSWINFLPVILMSYFFMRFFQNKIYMNMSSRNRELFLLQSINPKINKKEQTEHKNSANLFTLVRRMRIRKLHVICQVTWIRWWCRRRHFIYDLVRVLLYNRQVELDALLVL